MKAENEVMVTGDDASGGYDLAQHLVGLGHKRVAMLGKPPHRGAFDRVFGFTKALSKAGITLSEELIVAARNDEEVKVGVEKLLGLSSPPTAIFAYQDSLAALVYKHLGEAGVSIPHEMTVVGFDDLELATYLSPPLTTVGRHIEPLASEFVRLLIERIQGNSTDRAPQHIVITPRLVVRASCAPPRQAALKDFSK